MNAIAVHAALAAAAPGPSAAPANPEPSSEAGFATLLNEMSQPRASSMKSDAPAKDKPAPEEAPANAPDASTLSALQSLEAALNGFASLLPPPAAATRSAPAAAASQQPATTTGGAPVSAALTAVAGALGGGAWDVSGKVPLKAQLQADPSLGLSDFQMRTFLAVAGATPAKAGGTALGADSVWSPLSPAKTVEVAAIPAANAVADMTPSQPAAASAPKIAPPSAAPLAIVNEALAAAAPKPAAANPYAAVAALPAAAAPKPVAGQAMAAAPAPMPTVTDAAPPAIADPPLSLAAAQTLAQHLQTLTAPVGSGAGASNAPRNVAPRAASDKPSHGAPAAPVAGPASAEPVSPAGSSRQTSGGAARRGEGEAPAASSPETAAIAAAATAESAAAPVFSVPLANLPTFIADQANTLASANTPAARIATSTPAQTPKAAQAVKELNIALEPAELGQMTLKLRLTGGKLSVTIAVANPTTLSSIEDDRALIAARLGAGDQTLEDLVIQRQAPSTAENASSHGFSSDSGAGSSTTDGGSGSSSPRDPQSGAPPRGGAATGGAFGDLIV